MTQIEFLKKHASGIDYTIEDGKTNAYGLEKFKSLVKEN